MDHLPTKTTQGSLIVVGTGIQWAGQTTHAARAAIEAADRVLFAVADPWTVQWLRGLKPSAESLPYSSGNTPRRVIYAEMVRRILEPVRAGLRVCAVFYGHPGVLHLSAHEAIRQAHAEGLPAQMLPGVSFLDCLFADLGVDPGRDGIQLHEATDFLIRHRAFDVHSPLVLSQIGGIGNLGFFDARETERIQRGLRVLSEVLCRHFPASHEVIIYEAAVLPTTPPRMTRATLEELVTAAVSDVSTLYVPPLCPAPVDARMLELLGMASGDEEGTIRRSTQGGAE
jgi:precorrin-3B methylase